MSLDQNLHLQFPNSRLSQQDAFFIHKLLRKETAGIRELVGGEESQSFHHVVGVFVSYVFLPEGGGGVSRLPAGKTRKLLYRRQTGRKEGR